VDTVVCAPDDGWWYHPKDAEQFPDKINRVTLHLVGYILEYLFPYCSVILCHNTAAQEQHHNNNNKFILKRKPHFLSPYSTKTHPTVMPIYKY